MHACSWLPKGTTIPQTTWHETVEAAEAAMRALDGARYAVVWFDAGVYA